MMVNRVYTNNKLYNITCGLKDSSYPVEQWGDVVYEDHIKWAGFMRIPTEDLGKRVSYRIPVVVKNGLAEIGFLTGWSWQSGGTQYIDFNFYNLWLE